MDRIIETSKVNAPLSAVYNQWTQFEEFPKFMQHVESVRQIDDTHLHWKANVGAKTLERDSEIVEQIPHQRIAWRSTALLRVVPRSGERIAAPDLNPCASERPLIFRTHPVVRIALAHDQNHLTGGMGCDPLLKLR